MLLPLLLGAGAILLLMSKSEPSPLDKLRAMKESPAYKTGYKDGLAHGAKMMADLKTKAISAEQAKLTPEAKASGNAEAYAMGFVLGQMDGAKTKKGTTGTTGTTGTGGTTGTKTTTTTTPAKTTTDASSPYEQSVAGWSDGLGLVAQKSSNATYVEWFNKGRFTRGYEDYRTSGGSEKNASDAAYTDGWLQAYSGEANPYGTGP